MSNKLNVVAHEMENLMKYQLYGSTYSIDLGVAVDPAPPH